MWSGGVESTSMLKKLLEADEGLVCAHRLILKNSENRHEAETAAIQRLMPELRKIRGFYYSESTVELAWGRGIIWDYAMWVPIAMMAMRHHRCQYIVRGRCREDDWLRVWQGDSYRYIRYSTDHSWKRQLDIVRALADPHEKVETLSPYLHDYSQPKALHWQRLGHLAELTHSCRKPMNGVTPCMKCHACNERDAARNGTSTVPVVATEIQSGLHL